MSDLVTLVKMNLFARWISISYADEHVDRNMNSQHSLEFDKSSAMSVLNMESGIWWRDQLKYFDEKVYPEYVKNGSVKSAKEFLK